MRITVKPRAAIGRLPTYRPPKEGRVGKLRLDFNENTLGCAPGVVREVRRILTAEWLACYPEYECGRQALASYYGVSPSELLLTNGVDDAIKLICDTFVSPGDVLVTLAPTFPIYQFFHQLAGGRTRTVRYDQHLRLTGEKVLKALERRTRWVALANPNNPTGTLMAKSDIEAILRAAPRTLVLVDEAYFDFSGETVLPWIRKFPNLVVSRTFSKGFGLAGLRLGVLLAQAGLIADLRRAHAAFPVNSVAVACALAAIRHEDYVRRYARAVRTSRAMLCQYLDSLGVTYAPSATNFVLVRFGERSPEIARRLRLENILVRDWSYDPFLRSYLRITLGTASQTRRLIAALARQQHLMDTRDGAGGWRRFTRYSSTGYFA
jgi:histidinol-phosphate aminotransferase